MAPSDLPSRGGPLESFPYAGDWPGWADQLSAWVADLAEGETLVITAPEDVSRPHLARPARLFGLVPSRHERARPWVRLQRIEDHVRGTCIGAESFGGGFPFAPDEDDALIALGWHRPGPGDGSDYVRFWPDDVPSGPFLPRPEADRLAAMVATTVRGVFGVGEPGGLTTVRPTR